MTEIEMLQQVLDNQEEILYGLKLLGIYVGAVGGFVIAGLMTR